MIFSESYTIPSFLCDHHDTLHLWGAARLFQEVAEQHTMATHISYADLIKHNKAWVLIRMYYQVFRMPRFHESVMLNTWSRGDNSFFSFRDFSIVSSVGDNLVTATAVWAVIDFNSRRAVRLDDIMNDYEHHNILATDHDKLSKLSFPNFDNDNPANTFIVRNSMLDHTGHVNNAEYIKWIIDHQPEAFSQKDINAFEIDYIAETKPGENIFLYINRHDNMTCSQIRNSRGLSVLAQTTYTD